MPLPDATTSTKSTQSLWQNHSFTIFWVGQSVSYLGSGIASLILPLLVFDATHSVAQMGQVSALLALGNLLAGLTIGGIADRFDRRKLLLLSDGLAMVLFFTIPLIWALAGPHMLALLLLAAPIGLCSSVTAIGSAASLPSLVEREQLVEANGRLQGSLAVGYIAGPLLAGPLAGLWGPVSVISLNALSFLLSVVSLAIIRFRPLASDSSAPAPQQRRWAVGLRFIFQDARLRWAVILRLGVMLVLGGVFDLLVFRLKHELHQSDVVVGLVWGVGSVGAAIAGAFTAVLRRHLGFGVCFLGGLALMGVSLLALGMSAMPPFFVLLGISFTFGDVLSQVLGASLVQEVAPDDLQGRVAAASQLLLWLGASAGAAFSTTLAAQLGSTPPVFWGLGVLLLLLAALGLLTPARQRTPEQLNQTDIS